MAIMYKVKAFFGFVDEDEAPQEVKILADAPPQNRPVFRGVSAPPRATGAGVDIRLEEPRVYEDSLETASALRDGLPVILNLRHLDTDAQKRFIDFMCGTTYAVGGKMKKISDHIFLFTPPNVTVSAPDKSRLEKSRETEDRDFFRQGA